MKIVRDCYFYLERKNKTDFKDYEKFLNDPYMSDITDIIKKHGWYVVPEKEKKETTETNGDKTEEVKTIEVKTEG